MAHLCPFPPPRYHHTLALASPSSPQVRRELAEAEAQVEENGSLKRQLEVQLEGLLAKREADAASLAELKVELASLRSARDER